MLRGCADDTRNVLLRVVGGAAPALSCWQADAVKLFGQETVDRETASHLRIAGPAWRHDLDEWRSARPTADTVNHLPLGAGCPHDVVAGCQCPAAARFTVVCQGRWQEWAEQHGNGAEMERLVENQTPVEWRDILNLVRTPGVAKGKTLLLRATLYALVPAPRQLDPTTPAIDGTTAPLATDQTVELAGHVVRVPASAAAPPRVADLLPGLAMFADDDVVRRCHDRFRPLTGGGLKSLVQKCVRLHAAELDLEDGSEPVPAAAAAAVATLMLVCHPGTFSPELQLFTRGSTAALKRLGVILLEDAWLGGVVVRRLMALALATQQIPDHHLTGREVLEVCCLAHAACESPTIVSWRDGRALTGTVPVDPPEQAALADAAALLRTLRSFAGDMDMADKVAGMARGGSLPVLTAGDRPALMPVRHMVDQHTWRGIGHALHRGTFAQRFRHVFDDCTGLNPRLAPLPAWPADVRLAQELVRHHALDEAPSTPPTTGATVELRAPIDPGVLASAVGPVRIGRHVVLLGIVAPEDESVMLPPTRDPQDLFSAVSERDRAAAVAELRTRTLPLSSPIVSGQARFVSGEWTVDGEPWTDVVARGCVVELPELEPPELEPPGPAPLDDDAALRQSLMCRGDGVVRGAERRVVELMRAAPSAVALRALAMVRRQWTAVQLPTPALDGGQASDQLVAYADDPLVWRLLVRLARLVPSALRVAQLPRFRVPSGTALRCLEEWMSRACCGAAPGPAAPAWTDRLPSIRDLPPDRLMEHQRAAIDQMLGRDLDHDTSHFLVMDTGLGKTLTALVYAHHWLVRSGGAVRRILWVTPKGTPANLVKQLRDQWRVPVRLVPRVSTAAKPRAGETRTVDLEDWTVNVIEADHLRTAIDRGLAEAAPSSLVVFDEVDEMYSATKRTSAARRLAQLTPKFVAQTATPMRRHEQHLAMWLADTCLFPVTATNVLVAASGMVACSVELGIEAVDEVVTVPLTDPCRRGCRDALARGWAAVARVCREHTDDALVARAIEEAASDRATNPRGGVLLVAETNDHAARLVDLLRLAGANPGEFASMERGEHDVVVVPRHLDRGYNSAVRLGAMVLGVYPGNSASRHQMRGRIRRVGQTRRSVRYCTVVMDDTILAALWRRHLSVDAMNISLEQLGRQFGAEVLEPLN